MSYTTEAALRSKYPRDTAADLDRRCGPLYDLNSPALAKHRRAARDGLQAMPRADRIAYANAIEAAIHQSNNAWWKRGPSDSPKPYSGAQRRAQLNASLLACPSQIRRQRTPTQWREMYEAAMKEKQLLNSTTTTEAAAAFLAKRAKLEDIACQHTRLSSSAMKASPSQPTASRQKKQSASYSASKRRGQSPSTSTKTAKSISAITPASTDLAAKRSAAAYKAHETRRRMKAEAEARQ